MIDITGLDKGAVLKALYDNSQPLGMGFIHFVPGPMPLNEAQDIVSRCLDFDYLKGRILKVDLESDFLDPWGYDRDNGQGAAARAIDAIR